jgi:restriction system protein
MPIPGYQEFMLPILKIAGDGQEHPVAEAIETLAQRMEMSEEDRDILLPSGKQTRLYNRVTWAITYLLKSLLLEKVARGRFKITPRGLDVVRRNPPRIDNAFLDQFEEFRAFKTKRARTACETRRSDELELSGIDADVTPDERLDEAYKELRETLADDLLDRVRSSSHKLFEHMVVDLLKAMGYGGSEASRAQVVGRSGDGGIDGVIPGRSHRWRSSRRIDDRSRRGCRRP